MKRLLVLFALIALMHCGPNNNVGNDISLDISQLMPLTAGNTWYYVDTIWTHDTSGTKYSVQQTTLRSNGEMKITYKGNEALGYHLEWAPKNDNSVSRLVTSTSGNLSLIAAFAEDDTVITNGEQLLYKLNASSGSEWTSMIPLYNTEIGIFSIDSVEFRCTNDNTTLKTPYNEYTTIAYSYSFVQTIEGSTTPTTLKIIDYFVPGIGLVGSIHKVGSKTTRKMLLSNVTLK